MHNPNHLPLTYMRPDKYGQPRPVTALEPSPASGQAGYYKRILHPLHGALNTGIATTYAAACLGAIHAAKTWNL